MALSTTTAAVTTTHNKNNDTHLRRYRAHLRKRNHKQALSDLSSALKLKPTYKTALGQRAKVLRIDLIRHIAQRAKEIRHQFKYYCYDATITTITTILINITFAAATTIHLSPPRSWSFRWADARMR